MKRYISDLHFYGEELNNNFDNRQFKNVYEMNKYMIDQWNATVQKGDIVTVLGDMFATRDANEVNKILNRLSGKIRLIEGNHDNMWLKKEGVALDRFEWIKSYAEIEDGDNLVIASHYPIFCYNHQHLVNKDGSYRTYMLYGHVHNSEESLVIDKLQYIVRNTQTTDKHGTTKNLPSQMINCFCVRSDYKPLTLKEWIELENEIRTKSTL